jgi:hypothetical protein
VRSHGRNSDDSPFWQKLYRKIHRQSSIDEITSLKLIRRKYSWNTYRGSYCSRDFSLCKNPSFSSIEIGSSNTERDFRIEKCLSFEKCIEKIFDFIALDKSFFHIKIDKREPTEGIEYCLHLCRIFSKSKECSNDRAHART